jgi:hypothetical protein
MLKRVRAFLGVPCAHGDSNASTVDRSIHRPSILFLHHIKGIADLKLKLHQEPTVDHLLLLRDVGRHKGAVGP